MALPDVWTNGVGEMGESDASHVCKMKWKNLAQPRGKVGQEEEKWRPRLARVKLFTEGPG